VEVRFSNLNVAAECHVGTRALANATRDVTDWLLGLVSLNFAERKALHILKDVSGVIRPSRMTFLLGPPASGKTALLLALAGKLDPSLDSRGRRPHTSARAASTTARWPSRGSSTSPPGARAWARDTVRDQAVPIPGRS
jgi:ATPase subunit of ABC transporter with duplicated ATPase domains